MHTAQVFDDGQGQLVRLPEGFRFGGTAVSVRRVGNGVLLIPLDDPWALTEQGLDEFEPGLDLTRNQPAHQERPDLFGPSQGQE